jgi:two-component system OmpR family sensor kinase
LSAHSNALQSPRQAPGARRAPRALHSVWLALLVAGPAALLVFQLHPALDQEMLHNPLAHLLITLAASAIGVALALLVLHVARRAADGRIMLVGMGFLASASVFVTHSLSTPDVLMTGRGMATSLSALLSLLLGGIFFALGGLEISPALNRLLVQRLRLWLLLFLLLCLGYNWLLLFTIPTAMSSGSAPAAAHESYDEYGSSAGYDEHAAHEEAEGVEPVSLVDPRTLDMAQTLLVAAGLGCYAFAIARHRALYLHTPSRAGLGILFGMAFFGEALLTQYFSRVYTASFWLYHTQEFVGYGVIAYAVLGAYRRGVSDETLLESLFLSGTRARVQTQYAHAMEALIEALSRGEQPSGALRQRFGMSETQVQLLAGAARAVAQERRQRVELERLNTALHQLEEHKRQLTQMIVHDLKTPLTAMIGFVELLRMGYLDDDQRTLVDSALRSGRNLSDLIGDLLDVGQIEEGKLELEHSTFGPRELLTMCSQELRGWLAQEGKTLAIETPANLPLISADLRLLRRVLLNLLSNAIKHTLPGTHIVIRAFPYTAPHDAQPGNGGHIVVEVADDGPGIPAQHLELIFAKFGRFNREPGARQNSTGLGLTFCRLVVEAHGGTIDVSSIVGQGTTFRVILPAS